MAYRDENGVVRPVPLSWTDRKPTDMFLEVSAGRSILHLEDLSSFMHLVRSVQRSEQTATLFRVKMRAL